MNQEKARELFSAYYEGTLDGGLRQQFETRLQSDAVLRADFAAFSETMDSLRCLSEEEIEVPIFLNDRIATRLEEEERRRAQRAPALLLWLRGLALAGLATVAIGASVLAIRTSGDTATAGLVSGAEAPNLDKLEFSMSDRQLAVRYRAEESRAVTVSVPETGQVLRRIPLDGGAVEVPLSNPNADVAVLKVLGSGDAQPALVALPGKKRSTARTGSGAIADLARAIAGRFGVPVVVRGEAKGELVWEFTGSSAMSNLESALTGSGASVDQREGGLLVVLVN
jgi:anti-sigma factor RsiW